MYSRTAQVLLVLVPVPRALSDTTGTSQVRNSSDDNATPGLVSDSSSGSDGNDDVVSGRNAAGKRRVENEPGTSENQHIKFLKICLQIGTSNPSSVELANKGSKKARINLIARCMPGSASPEELKELYKIMWKEEVVDSDSES